MLSIENTLNRTLFFDYGTIIFQNSDWTLKIHMYSTTGQDFYCITRPAILKGIDGIVFVVDSRKLSYHRNVISWNELKSYFKKQIKDLPVIISFNKQDLRKKFNSMIFINEICYEEFNNLDVEYTVALNGEGILESFEKLVRLIFQDITNSQLLSREGSFFTK